MEKMFASAIIGKTLSKATTPSFSLEKSIIFIVDNCGGQFKVKLHLTEEIKKLLNFMVDNGIIENWMPIEEDLYEI